MKPPISLDGSLGTPSMTSNTSSRSALGSVIFPDFVGTPLMGASRLQANPLPFKADSKLSHHGPTEQLSEGAMQVQAMHA